MHTTIKLLVGVVRPDGARKGGSRIVGRQVKIAGIVDDSEASTDRTSIGVYVVAASELSFAVLAILLASPSNFKIMVVLDGRAY